MKTKLLSIIFFFYFTISIGQTWQWATQAGGIGSDKGTDIAIDNNGNSYVGGYFNVGQPAAYTATFGAITPSIYPNSYGKEGFLGKVDKYGNWQWVNSALGGYDERVLGVHVDKVNNYVYATGTTWGWYSMPYGDLAFGTCSMTCNSSYDQIFVAKFDLSGNCQWVIDAGGGSDDHGYDMVTDVQGNIYLTGFLSDFSLSPLPPVFGAYTASVPPGDSISFVAKIAPWGAFQWVRTFGNCDGERDNKIAIDRNANVYITGGFHGAKAFGTTTLTSNSLGLDIFVVKYDLNGNFIWAQQAGGIYDDRANNITVDDLTQKIYITGEFRDYAYFGTDTINNNGGPGGRDIFVAKMNTAGNWLWAKKAGSKLGGERGNGICSNDKGNIFVTGQFADTAKFGPTIQLISSPTTSIDVFVAAIDSLGKWQWAIKGGGINEDRGNGIACDDSCNIYTAGYYEGAVTFGANNLSPYLRKDIYAAKINSACFNYVLNFDELFAHESSVFLFPNPATDVVQIKLNFEGLNSADVKITFLDLLGRKVNVTQQTNTDNLIFDISSLSQGVYSVNLLYEGKTKVVKFVKQ